MRVCDGDKTLNHRKSPSSDNKQGEQLPGNECKPQCGEVGCSATKAISGQESERQLRPCDSNGNVASSSWDWLDSSLHLNVPLVDVDKARPKRSLIKDLEVEGKGSNAPSSKNSQHRDNQPTVSHISQQNLPMNCLTLHMMLQRESSGHLINVTLDGGLFHYNQATCDVGLAKEDIEHLFKGQQLGITVIQTFMRALQEDLVSREFVPKVGWMCPQTTSNTMLKHENNDSNTYINRCIDNSVKRGAQYILAPIIQDEHWTLIVICPVEGIIYFFDSVWLGKRRDLMVAVLINRGLKIFQKAVGSMKRTNPLWKEVECAQQEGRKECGYFVMKYMYDIVGTCIDAKDVAELAQNQRYHPFNKEEIDEVREKFAKYD